VPLEGETQTNGERGLGLALQMRDALSQIRATVVIIVEAEAGVIVGIGDEGMETGGRRGGALAAASTALRKSLRVHWGMFAKKLPALSLSGNVRPLSERMKAPPT